ncbi:PIN domain-containing protein [Aquirufa sp. TARAVU-A1A]|jgi:predicted nucleic acid-binding protein
MNLTDIPARYYFDTSIFGGYFDDEFSAETRALFNQVNEGKIICLFSDLIAKELNSAPSRVRELFDNLPTQSKESLLVNQEIAILAEEYINQKVVGKTSRDDCIHIATATIYHANALVSWNFKHIVNSNRIIGYNQVNSLHGLPEITIKSPREII